MKTGLQQLIAIGIAVLIAWPVPGVSQTQLISPDSSVPRPPFAVSQGFLAFRADVDRLNSQRVEDGKAPWFSDVKETGKGAVHLVARESWIGSSLTDRQSSLQLMVNLWSMRTGLDDGIILVISDKNGIPLMQGSR